MPFVDVTVIDADENPQGCPLSHPEELIFEIWHGSMGYCSTFDAPGDVRMDLVGYRC